MSKALIVLLCLSLTGCAAPRQSLNTKNRQNLNALSLGMSKDEAIAVMGSEPVKIPGGLYTASVSITNPHKTETIQTGGRTLTLVYYVTELTWDERQVRKEDLTPLVFEYGGLIGWGWEFLEANIDDITRARFLMMR
ncbi:DUF3192 domain-containing protein [Candidatus Omnitrophota bacterium]